MRWDSVFNSARLLICCLVAIAIVNTAPRSAFSEQSLNQPTVAAAVERPTADDTAAFFYKSAGRRDPFEPLVNQLQETSRIVVAKPRGPLQEFELTQFRLMAVVVVKGRPMAMVKAPDGKSYPVKVGDEIGRYEGKVTNIEIKRTERDALGKRVEKSPDRIIVEETVRDNSTGKQSVEYRYLTM
jgi:Tfp pilus assembly protein PilP